MAASSKCRLSLCVCVTWRYPFYEVSAWISSHFGIEQKCLSIGWRQRRRRLTAGKICARKRFEFVVAFAIMWSLTDTGASAACTFANFGHLYLLLYSWLLALSGHVCVCVCCDLRRVLTFHNICIYGRKFIRFLQTHTSLSMDIRYATGFPANRLAVAKNGKPRTISVYKDIRRNRKKQREVKKDNSTMPFLTQAHQP